MVQLDISDDFMLRWTVDEIIQQECSGAIGVDKRDVTCASQRILDKISDWIKNNQKELK